MDKRTPPLTVGRPEPKRPVKVDAPYPPLTVEGPNRQYARMLTMDLASDKSEMTAITQYLYQGWELKKEYAEISDTLMRIAQVEIHHLDMLGQLIVLLGGDPRFLAPRNNRLMPWNGNMVFYSRMVKPMLENSLQKELSAAEGYLRQAQLIHDEHLSLILKRIAMDEELHVKILQQYCNSL